MATDRQPSRRHARRDVTPRQRARQRRQRALVKEGVALLLALAALATILLVAADAQAFAL